mgnify:CR=1 FL=1
MPAPPERLQRPGPVRLVEIAREGIAQQGRGADRHVRIGREVTVDLDRIAIDGGDHVQRPVGGGIEEDRIDQTDRQFRGDHRLLEQAPDDQQQAVGRHLARQARRPVELRQQVRGPHDRSRHQMREEAHQQHHIQQRARHRRLAPIHIDHIADALEGEEADPDRQDHLQQRQVPAPAELVQQFGRLLDEKAVVFEESQHQQVEGDAQPDQPFASAVVITARDRRRHAPVENGAQDQQADKAPVPLGVEEPAGQQQEQLAPPVLAIQRPAGEIDEQEEDAEGQGGEQHLVALPRGGLPAVKGRGQVGGKHGTDPVGADGGEMHPVAAHVRIGHQSQSVR